MSDAHTEWIRSYVARTPFVRGKCATATTEMVAAFPELRRVGGLVEVEWPGATRPVRKEQHWWCVAPDGEIIDPTVSQFAIPPFSDDYEELDLTSEEARARVPTGRCVSCGEDAFGGEVTCSDECAAAYVRYMNEPREYV